MHKQKEFKLMFFDEIETLKELINLISEKGKQNEDYLTLTVELLKIEKQLKKLLK